MWQSWCTTCRAHSAAAYVAERAEAAKVEKTRVCAVPAAEEKTCTREAMAANNEEPLSQEEPLAGMAGAARKEPLARVAAAAMKEPLV